MAKRAGYEVYGLPNYVVWHIDDRREAGQCVEDPPCPLCHL